MEIQEELSRVTPTTTAEESAEIATMFGSRGEIITSPSGAFAIQLEIASSRAAGRVYESLSRLDGVHATRYVSRSSGDVMYGVRVAHGADVALKWMGLLNSDGRIYRNVPVEIRAGGVEVSAASWRGALLASEVDHDGIRGFSPVVSFPSEQYTSSMAGVAHKLGVRTRMTRSSCALYVDDPRGLINLLTACGAQESATIMEERAARRRYPDHGYGELETSNTRRSSAAAAEMVGRVTRALEILGDDIPDTLAESARLRVENPTASLSELGSLASPPVSKDTVAGRLRRLVNLSTRAR